MSFRVFVTSPSLAEAGMQRLREHGCSVDMLQCATDVEEVRRIMASHPIDAVISRTVALPGDAIEACKSLKVVCKHGVGVSNIDTDACTRRRIPVYVTRFANAQSVAEMTLALMFAAARRLVWFNDEIRAGRWTRAEDGLLLEGRTIGLVGFGEVGRRVGRSCAMLGMTVQAYDPQLPVLPLQESIKFVGSLQELLATSDVISLHVPLTPKTRHLIGPRELASMPKGSIVVNTARGEVVDESALVAAIKSGHLFAAALDTMQTEPLPLNSPLRNLPNVILTPHVAGSTPAAITAMAYGAADIVMRALHGHPIDRSSCVNPEVLPEV